MLIDCFLGKKVVNKDKKTGNVIEQIEYTKTPILCEYRSLSNKEFYQSQATGYKPELTLKISIFDYNNEEFVKYGEFEYTIIKTNNIFDNPDDILLTLQRGIKDVNS